MEISFVTTENVIESFYAALFLLFQFRKKTQQQHCDYVESLTIAFDIRKKYANKKLCHITAYNLNERIKKNYVGKKKELPLIDEMTCKKIDA